MFSGRIGQASRNEICRQVAIAEALGSDIADPLENRCGFPVRPRRPGQISLLLLDDAGIIRDLGYPLEISFLYIDGFGILIF